MTSRELKHLIMQYWRYDRQVAFVADEVNASTQNISDVLLVNGRNIIEVECKISISDFYADFKKYKHHVYATGENNRSCRIPDLLYYAVPAELKHSLVMDFLVTDEAKKKGWNRYGVMRVFGRGCVLIEKKAMPLMAHVSPTEANRRICTAKTAIMRRLSSEVIGMRKNEMKERRHA